MSNGSGSCAGKKWALVKYSNAEGGRGSYISYKPPIEVTTERSLNTFKGGQCPCIKYRFDFLIRYRTYGTSINYETNEPYYVIYEDSVSGAWDIHGGMSQEIEEISPGQLEWRVRGTDANCQPFHRSLLIAGSPPSYIRGELRSNRAENISFTLMNVRRLDGQPDNCGDPPSGCFLVIRQGGSEVFRKKGIGSTCPKFQIGCSDDCPEGMHKEPDGKCCCDNSQDLKRLTSEIRNQLKGMR